MTIEMLVLAPFFLAALMFVAWAIAQPEAEGAAHAAARVAARAAALAESPSAAVTAGVNAGNASGAESGCQSFVVSVDTTLWFDGWVSASASCEARSDGMGPLGGGTMSAQWTEAVEQAARRGR